MQIAEFATEFGVCERTIKTDIDELKKEYPIETIRGNGGGVRMRKDNKYYRGTWTEEQQNAVIAIIELIKVLHKPLAKILGEMLVVCGSFRNKEKIEIALAEI